MFQPNDAELQAAKDAKDEAACSYTMMEIGQGPGEGNYDRIEMLTLEDIIRAVNAAFMERLRDHIGESEVPNERARRAHNATMRAANDPYDDTGWAEPMTDAILAALDAAADEMEI
jgi:hypothetical protein